MDVINAILEYLGAELVMENGVYKVIDKADDPEMVEITQRIKDAVR